MILIDKMKNLKIYRTQTFLPQLKEDKKKHSAVILMTPNYESSKKLMNHNLFVNKKRYESYYLDRDVSFYIGSKKLEEIDESFLYLAETKRSNLKDSEFGIPEDRKFPLDTEQHVRSAIKLFGHAHCSEEQKKTLARKISRRAKEYNIEIPETTLVYKYLHESVLECSDTNKNQKIFNIEKTDINSVKFFPNEEKRYDSIVVFNSIKDKCFRGRSVCLVIKDDSEVYLDFTFKYGDYDIPGGGWDPNEPHDVTATRECGEEAKLKVVDATYAGNYIEIFSEDDNRKHIDAIYWDGDYTELFVGKYAGKYEQKIADVDRSDTLIGGRFYPIAEVYNKLEDIHKAAILQYLGEEKLNKLLENSDNNVSEFVDFSNTYGLENVLSTGDKYLFFGEDAKYDAQLKRLLYNSRIKSRKEVLEIYDRVQKDNPWIKYTFPDINRYMGRNLFVDTYFYTSLFFENNKWTLQKGLNLYLDFVNKLVNKPELTTAGYKNRVIMIPVDDWDEKHDGTLWNYRSSLNPMSLIYQFMYTDNLATLQKTFGDIDILFVGRDQYFKINFSQIDKKDCKKLSVKFKTFLVKFSKNEQFDVEDIDTTADFADDKDVIKAKVIDKIEDSRGVDLTPDVAKAEAKAKKKSDEAKKLDASKSTTKVSTTVKNTTTTKTVKTVPDKNKPTVNDIKKEKLADSIVDKAKDANSEDDLLDQMDTDQIRDLILSIEPDEGVKISAARASRLSELDKKVMEVSVKGKTVKEILENPEVNKEIVTKLDLATPNTEWEEMKFVNFDKTYDIDRDIIRCFRHFAHTSCPISIRNISVKDNSTSEDRLELYTVEMEDSRAKRFTIKLDIPIMEDNRFLLRGDYKSIQTQFQNMPIIKTEDDTVQIISNYMKIFISRFGSGSGKSTNVSAKFIKAAGKYTGKVIKFYTGNNEKICLKYELPIDYIDVSSVYSKVETPNHIIYFNQDEIRELYELDAAKGIPYGYDKKNKEVMYFGIDAPGTIIDYIASLLSADDNAFGDLYMSASKPSICTYSRASIMSSKIPLVVICAYNEGLRTTMDKGAIKYQIVDKLTKEIRNNINYDWIKFSDGYVVYEDTYSASLLMNGLKECNTEDFSIADMDSKTMYLEFLDDFGGRIKADGLDNFYDLTVDPMTRDTLQFYHMPTDYIQILLYANNLLADNKFIRHTDTSSRRFRRYQLVAVYTYKVLADAYNLYANQLKHSASGAAMVVKQSAVVDKFLTDSITSDDSVINALRDLETTNAVTTKGPSGMNSARAYSLDKRTYDESMLNVLGISTGFSGNVGITRQATMNANVTADGYVKSINGDLSKLNTANTLTATEAVTPFGSNHDDPMRTAMTFVQTAKHYVRTVDSDPLLVTSGADEALPYLSTDRFAFKSKKAGKVLELTDEFVLLEYADGTKDSISLIESIEKNSDGGYYVPLKLDIKDGLKVGSKFKANEILAYDKESYSNCLGESDNIAYNIGKLAKVAIINSDEGYEDSGVISQSMADKLATRIDYKYDMKLDKDTIVYEFAKVGQHIEAGEPLMIWQSPFEDEDANALIKNLGSKEEVSELGKRRLVSEVTGTVKGIKIYRTVEVSDLSDSLKKIVNAYEKPYKEMEAKYREHGLDISKIPAHYKLEPTGKMKKSEDSVLVEFYVEYQDTVGVGDKVVYFSANKAVEKGIFPIGKEPYTEFRPNEIIDAFVSTASISKRMVLSTMIYGSLQKLMIELDRSVKDIMDIPYDDSKV